MRLVVLISLLLGLLLAAPAHAARDSDRDRMPDRWERANGLKPGKRDGARDRDRDGLTNRAEYRTGHDPRDRDSDDDGLADGREITGVVAALTGDGVVVRTGRSRVTVTLDPDTVIACRPRAGSRARARAAQWPFPGADDPENADEGDDEEVPADEGEPAEEDPWAEEPFEDPEHSEDAEEEFADPAEELDLVAELTGVATLATCPPGALTKGAVVHEASLLGGVAEYVVLLVA
jgi:hypothetical protein